MPQSYIARLTPSNLGKSNMHEIYWVCPKRQVDPTVFYGHPPKNGKRIPIKHKDLSTGKIYEFLFGFAKKPKLVYPSGEFRLTQVSNYLKDKNAEVHDELEITKHLKNHTASFTIDYKNMGVLPKEKKHTPGVIYEKNYNPAARGYRSGKTRKAGDIISKAEIYKVIFTVEQNTYVYVGQDSHCAGTESYFGSSLVMWHYEQIFGKGIFDKKILKKVQEIKQSDLNSLERKHINEAEKEAIKNEWFCLNYTGKGKVYS